MNSGLKYSFMASTYACLSSCIHEPKPADDLCAFFEPTIRDTLRLGGDADTQCAMTGAIAEAMWGMPKSFLSDERKRLERSGLSDDMDAFVNGCDAYRESLSL